MCAYIAREGVRERGRYKVWIRYDNENFFDDIIYVPWIMQ